VRSFAVEFFSDIWEAFMPVVRIPAGQVAAGQMPHVCARHGEPAAVMRKIKLISKPAPWTPILIFLAVIVYVIVVTAMRKTVTAPAWPWCAQCKSGRSKMLGIGFGLIGVAVLALVVGVGMGSDATPIATLVALVALIAGIIVASRGGAQTVSGAFVSRDGQFVEVPKPNDRFAYALSQGGAVR
jgi:hypothetical protein